ncbi:glycosyltransferase family 25 protein [Neisseria zalophi]|uniref:Glycosyl transferase family 25 domain-containing protein n=1 Tax=Neisseria zalophi TaxID=640030 RepID=A0A5J6Q111_9NEIS|nr:glycosyltransferase family 25 protein [Neisseria zalophi]QEY27033.1 hypothetical protein D0T92_11135 [Neisseria zalophi]
MLKNYVISINTASSRRAHITQEFGKQNIPFEFFDAVTPTNGLTQSIARFIPALAEYPYQTPGEKSCFISHVLLLQKCIDENLPYIGIFEDDILLGEHADLFLTQDNWLKERFKQQDSFIIKLETYLMRTRTQPESYIQPYNNRSFHILNAVHVGTAGYIISTQAARIILQQFNTIQRESIKAIDIMLFKSFLNHPNLKIFQLHPALCVQEDRQLNDASKLKSQLHKERALNWEKNPEPKPKRTFQEHIIRALGKFKRIQEKKKSQIVPFK